MIDKIIIIFYLFIITVIGITAYKKTKNNGFFYTSNGKTGIFTTVAVLTSGFIGGGYSVGNAAECYEYGIDYSLALCGFSVGMILFSVLLLPTLNPKGNTVGEVIEYSYGKKARKLSAVFSFLFCLGILSAQLFTLKIILSEFFGLNGTISAVVSALLIIIYSTAGGMNAVIKTDTAQFIVLITGIPLLFIFSLINAGGIEGVKTVTTEKSLGVLEFISLTVAFAFGEMLTPQLVQKLKITKRKNDFKNALIISSIISAVIFIMVGAVGVGAHRFIEESGGQNILISAAIRVMPIGLKGIVGASLCAVLITSADTALNSAAASLSNDLLEHKTVALARTVNVVVGIVATVTVVVIPNVIELLMVSYKFWCPVVFSQLLYALRGRKADERLFTVPAITGIISVFVWDSFLKTPFGVSSVAIGLIINAITFKITKTAFTKGQKP